MKKIEKNQKGFVLPLVLVMLALLAGVVSCFLAQGNAELKANVMNRNYELCILTAKNAMAVAQSELEEDVDYTGTPGMAKDENGGYYSIELTRISETQRFLDIESRYDDYTKKITGELEIIPDSNGSNKAEIKEFKWKMAKPE